MSTCSINRKYADIWEEKDKIKEISKDAEMIMYLIIMSVVALIMIIIGIFRKTKKDEPVGFYNGVKPPKKEEISDVLEWNRQH